MLAGSTGTNEAMLRASIALKLGICERMPVRIAVLKARNEAISDVRDRNADKLRWALMTT
jgi:hypothetical protein